MSKIGGYPMSRTFLVSILFFQFGGFAFGDTLIDVFDESLNSQFMTIDFSEFTSTPVVEESNHPTTQRKSKFLQASTSYVIKRKVLPTINFWTPGNYPDELKGPSVVDTSVDAYFQYFADDSKDQLQISEFDLERSFTKPKSASHNLKEISGNKSR